MQWMPRGTLTQWNNLMTAMNAWVLVTAQQPINYGRVDVKFLKGCYRQVQTTLTTADFYTA